MAHMAARVEHVAARVEHVALKVLQAGAATVALSVAPVVHVVLHVVPGAASPSTTTAVHGPEPTAATTAATTATTSIATSYQCRLRDTCHCLLGAKPLELVTVRIVEIHRSSIILHRPLSTSQFLHQSGCHK